MLYHQRQEADFEICWLCIQVHGIADAGSKAKSSCGGVCESVLVSCMSPAPTRKSDWASRKYSYWAGERQSRHTVRKLDTCSSQLYSFYCRTISQQSRSILSIRLPFNRSRVAVIAVHYDSCAVLCLTVKTHCLVYAHCQPCPKRPQPRFGHLSTGHALETTKHSLAATCAL
jgi:hypothetical protein